MLPTSTAYTLSCGASSRDSRAAAIASVRLPRRSASTAVWRLASAMYGRTTPPRVRAASPAKLVRRAIRTGRVSCNGRAGETTPHRCIAAAATIQKGSAAPSAVKLTCSVASYARQAPSTAYAPGRRREPHQALSRGNLECLGVRLVDQFAVIERVVAREDQPEVVRPVAQDRPARDHLEALVPDQ